MYVIVNILHKSNNNNNNNNLCRDSVVGIATRYGLEGSRIESRWAARISALDQASSEVHWVTGLFPGSGVAGAW